MNSIRILLCVYNVTTASVPKRQTDVWKDGQTDRQTDRHEKDTKISKETTKKKQTNVNFYVFAKFITIY